MMVAHGCHVGTRLVNLAMDDALGVERDARRPYRLGVEIEFQNIVGLDQLGRARAR
jgi:hypothetical protein